MTFLAYALKPEAQAAIAEAYTYGPVVPKAFELIPAERARILSGGPQMRDKAIMLGEKWWGENLNATTEKVTAWKLS
jgi:putative spermidine/putrescine transport system substrate-binding protein